MAFPLPVCPACQCMMVQRQNRTDKGWFLGCSRFPTCKGTRPITTFSLLCPAIAGTTAATVAAPTSSASTGPPPRTASLSNVASWKGLGRVLRRWRRVLTPILYQARTYQDLYDLQVRFLAMTNYAKVTLGMPTEPLADDLPKIPMEQEPERVKRRAVPA